MPGSIVNLDDDIIATFDHDNGQLLGRTSSGTLELNSDDNGLMYRVNLADTTISRDLMAWVERGDISGSSFEFSVNPDGDEWEFGEDDIELRTVVNSNLFQVGPVVLPAYKKNTAVAIRSLDAWLESHDGGAEKIAAHRRRLALLETE